MGISILARILIALCASGIVGNIVNAAPPAPLTALSMVEAGQWELKTRGTSAGKQLICISDARVLMQPRHIDLACNRFVITNESRVATIQYSCPGMGSGRTMLRVETPRLVQIESQGIAGIEPFSIKLEGRRIGQCGAIASSFRR